MKNVLLMVVVTIASLATLLATACGSNTETVEVIKEVEKIVQGPERIVEKEKIVEKNVVKEVEVIIEVEKSDPSITPQYGGTHTLALNDWVNLDPMRFESNSLNTAAFWAEGLIIGNWAIDRNIFDFPMGPLRSDAATGHLAKSFELAPDLQTINLEIRDDVYWHDKNPTNGRQMTVEDVIWNICGWWKTDDLIDRQFSSLIDSCTKKGDWGLELKISTPVIGQALMGIMDNDSHIILPKEIRETESGEVEDWKMVSGTGPWVMSNLVPDSKIEFERNENYWDFDEKHPENRLPYADAHKLLIIPDESARFAAWRTGKLDILENVAIKKAGSLLVSDPDSRSKTKFQCCPMALRMRNDLEPFDDIRLRMAVSMAIDRQTIVETYYDGQADFYAGLLKPFHGDLYSPYEELPSDIQEILTYNPDKARELVKEAGFGDGLKVDLNVSPDTNHNDMAQMVQSYLKDIGIEVDIIRDEWPEFNAKRYGKQHKGLIIHWNSFYADPMQLFVWFTCDNEMNRNLGKATYPECLHKFGLSGVNDPTFDKMYNDAMTEMDDAKRNEMMKEMELYSLRNVHYATTPAPDVVTIWHNWVGGYQGEGSIGQYDLGSRQARLWIVSENK